MIGKIFGVLTALSVIFAVYTGKIAETGMGVVEGAETAVKLTISLVGIICLWNGVMQVFLSIRIIEKLSKIISPLLRFLYPGAYKLKKSGDKDAAAALQAISANIGANILGVGNAATPLGIKAMQILNKIKKKAVKPDAADRDMIMFAVFNCASIQAVPVTLTALRTSAGSSDVFGVIPAIWLCSLAGAVISVTLVKLFGKIFK